MPDDATTRNANVASLWRYPVKSMQGQRLSELRVESSGVAGDRAYGVLKRESGTILSAKREGRLLDAAAELRAGVLVVTLPSGEEYHEGGRLDHALSEWLGYPVALVVASTFGVATFESPVNFERDDSEVVTWEGHQGRFVDESALHLLRSQEMAQLSSERPDLQWDVRRFRPNVVVDDGEDALCLDARRRVGIGEVEVEIEKPCSRCVMTTRTQPGGLERQLDVLRHVSRAHDGSVGTRARVLRPGVVREGDDVRPLE